MLDLNSVVKKDQEFPWSMVEEQAVLLDQDEEAAIRLNDVASSIWDLVNGERTAGQIAIQICGSFDVNRRRAEKDVLNFLKILLREGIIDVKERAGQSRLFNETL